MANPISDVTRRVVYSGSAGVGPYVFSFEVLAQTDVAVYKDTTLLTLTTDYSVTINADGTGSVTLVVAATGDNQITLVGDRSIERSTDFVTGGDLFANSLNDEFDSLVIFTQQVKETADRGLKAAITDPTDVNMTLPDKANRKGKVLAFDSTTGDPVSGPALDSMITVIEQSANINSVADSIADVNAVAADIANVDTVAGNISNVNTVAGVSGNVTTVAGISVDVTTVSGVNADVTTVAGISGNVTTVAGVSANVTTVAGISADVTTVAADSADIQLLADNIAVIGDKVSKTADTGSAVVPAGTEAQRDGTPAAGYFRFNSDTNTFEGYNGTEWGAIGGGGASGGGNDAIFYENGQTITTDYTITASNNAMSTGPITINSGVAVTIPSGSRWAII